MSQINDIKTMCAASHIYNHSSDTLESVSIQIAAQKDCAQEEKRMYLADITSTFILRSLSSEIALKVILKCEGKDSVKGHDLKSLFDQLDLKHQEQIKNDVDNKDFDTLISDHKDNFVSWRYFYEGYTNSVNVPFLKSLTNAVNSLANKLVLEIVANGNSK